MVQLALCPFARYDPDGSTPGPRMTPTQAILHVSAAERDSQAHGGLEWHFEIDYDGNVEQQVMCNLQAAANYKANVRAISIETWGLGDGFWTAKQINAILRLLRWLNSEWGVPLVQTPAWDKPGIGYHILWGTPGMWTPVAKACPGKNRIQQYKDIILPALAAGGEVHVPNVKEADVMADILAYFLVYLGMTEDEIMNSQEQRENVSYHTWQLTSGQKTPEQKRAEIEAWARGQKLYPKVPSKDWWK